MASSVQLASFRLERPIGRGGMGQVWLGVHEASGEQVAVKVLAGTASRAALQAFQEEVEAVAGMYHPGIVLVYDHGTLGTGQAEALELPAGSPWLAMQYCSRGSLDQGGRPRSWPELRSLLTRLLDALAHAHARDVIHRDLKPANVLLGGARDVRTGYCIADFGLARHASVVARDRGVSGTPLYMAPEQFLGQGEAQGPWTDLYAIGVLAYELASGRTPFGPDGFEALKQAHLVADVPPLVPSMAVPSDLEAFVARLMSKEIADRPASAAEAVALLEAVSGPSIEGTTLPPAPDRSETFTWSTLGDEPAAAPPALPTSFGAAPERAFPRGWRRIEPALPTHLLSGAGLALLGVRPAPFVAREVERGALWDALEAVVTGGGTRAVLVQGEPGSGRSRLATWLVHRVRELDACCVVHLDARTGRSLATAIAAHYRLWSLEGEARRAHLEAHARCGEALASVLDRTGDAAHAAALWLRELAEERPTLVVADDLDTDGALLRAFERLVLLDAVAPVPLLLVGVSAPGGLGSLDAAATIEVPPLRRREMAALVRNAVPLEPGLAEEVALRAAGSPSYALALVQHWVACGALASGPAGFTLDAGQLEALDSDPDEAWLQPLRAALAALPEAERSGMLIAGLVGLEVPEVVWGLACADAGVSAAPAAVEAWVRRGLVQRREGGFGFARAAVREGLARISAAHPEARSWCGSVAAAWVQADDSGDAKLRAGRLLAGAGRHAEAAAHFFDAARQADDHDVNTAERLVYAFEAWERAMHAAGVPEADPAWRDGLRGQLAAVANSGRGAQALELAHALVDRGERHGWPDLEKLYSTAGQVAARYRDAELARTWLQRVLDLCPRADGTALRLLGQLAQRERAWEEALQYAHRAVRVFTAERDVYGLTAAYNEIGVCHRQMGALDAARVHFERARQMCERHGTGEPLVIRLNLLDLELLGDIGPETHATALALLEEAERRLTLFPLAATTILVFETAAAVGDWEAFDAAVARARGLEKTLAAVADQVQVILGRAGHRARDAHHFERARICWTLAHHFAVVAGDSDAVGARVRDLASLSSLAPSP